MDYQNSNLREPNAKADYNARHSVDIDEYHRMFTDRLKKAREAKDLTQEEAAKLLDISLPTYRKYEQTSGNRIDIPYFFGSLTKLLDVSADYLIGNSNTPHPEYEDVIKTTGLNEKSIHQLQQLCTMDKNENYPGYLDFINSFLGNDDCTSLFFQGLAPLLRNLNDAMSTSERMTNALSLQLADYLYDYIVKVVVPSYMQLYSTGKYTPANVEQYLSDGTLTSKKDRG